MQSVKLAEDVTSFELDIEYLRPTRAEREAELLRALRPADPADAEKPSTERSE